MKAKKKTKSRNNKKPGNKEQKKKIIVASLAVGAAGILGFFGWQYLKKKKEAKGSLEFDRAVKPETTSISYEMPTTAPKPKATIKPSYTVPVVTSLPKSGFPLKKGSKGENVRLLQEALIAKYGKAILPKYGADGDFGTETLNALKKAGLPSTIDESTFNVVTQSMKVDKSALGKDLFNATVVKDFNKTISLLKMMTSKADYSTANEVFKTYRIGAVRQTIVNGLLNTFTKADQKEKIKLEFLRMGLQFDGSKWSLSGIDGRPIVTKESTTVWTSPTEGVKVPARMVLGSEVSRRLDYTLFENKGKYFLVNSKSVQYL